MRIAGRTAALTAVFWVVIDLIVIAVSILPECGLGMCPDDPSPTANLGDVGGWTFVLTPGVIAVIIAFVIARAADRRMSSSVPR